MKKGFAQIVIIAAATLLISAGLIFSFLQKNKTSEKLTSSASPVLQYQSDETTNWRTYSNTFLKYSFNYPNDWILFRDSSPAGNNGCDYCKDIIKFSAKDTPPSDYDIASVRVFENKGIKTIDDLIKGLSLSEIEMNYITIANEKALYYKPKVPIPAGIRKSRDTYYIVVKNSLQYELKLFDSPETNKNKVKYQKTFNQILSTFKFIN